MTFDPVLLQTGKEQHNGHSENKHIASFQLHNRGYAMGVASRLVTVIYVAMVMLILYDNSYSLNNSNLKYKSY